jgi:hypothetical protein
VSVAKSVLSIENISALFRMQKATYSSPVAYNYFCSELENMLMYICGSEQEVRQIGSMNSEEKTLLRSVIIAVAHILYANTCFDAAKHPSEQ